jgi:hypothetical protein
MKKIGICILVLVLLVCAGCGTAAPSTAGGDTTTVKTTETAPATALAWVQTLGEKLPFDDQMSDTDQATNVYGIFEEDGYTGDSAMRISTMATPEEIAVFRADAVFSTERLCALARTRIEQQKASYADYAPNEVPKLDTAVIRVCGVYVIVCVCADNALAEQVLDAYGAKAA